MNSNHKNFLLNLARRSIKCEFDKKEVDVKSVPSELKDVGCCFVTLILNGELRGCIGHLEAFEPLYKNVINNAINAAFHDSRFRPLSREEFDDIKIEISVLSKPERLVYLNPEDLLNKLSNKQGVILKKGYNQSTFLPQVWDVIPDKSEFLENLCIKAGLHPGAWLENPEIFVYNVLKFSE